MALQNTPFAGRQLEMSGGYYAPVMIGGGRGSPPDVAALSFKTGPDSVVTTICHA